MTISVTTRAKSISEEQKPSSSCNRCKNPVKKDDKGVGCETCGNWFRIACEGISNDQYKVMTKDECKIMHWFCKDCEADILSTGKVIHTIKVRQDKLEQELAIIMDTINLRPTKAEMISVIESKIDEKLQHVSEMQSKLDEKLQHKPTVDEVMTIIETKFAEFSLSQAESRKQAEPRLRPGQDVVSKHVDSKMEQWLTGNLTVVQKVLEDTLRKWP